MSHKHVVVLALAVLGVLAAVGIGYAAIPSSDGVIHGCLNTSSNPSGALRVIDTDAGAKCAKNEKALNFNQQGPKGDPGAPGPKGDQGAPGVSTATFAFTNASVYLGGSDSFVEVLSKHVPEGSWAVVATANSTVGLGNFGGDRIVDMTCVLRNGSDVIGSATDRRVVPADDAAKRSVSMNGGAAVPAGGGTVSLWCKSQLDDDVDQAQMMLTQVGSFS